jgi:hypothetical protein
MNFLQKINAFYHLFLQYFMFIINIPIKIKIAMHWSDKVYKL